MVNYKIHNLPGANVSIKFDVNNSSVFCITQSSILFNFNRFRWLRYILKTKFKSGRRLYILRGNDVELKKVIKIDNYFSSLGEIQYHYNAYFKQRECEIILPNKQWLKLYEYNEIYGHIVLEIQNYLKTNKETDNI